ncbi:MAG TPA: hypothetical protein VD788_13475 [Candidatus Polarisedimenticolaceae bacterium]|nr:hypothetical protein [Candidatus Polarisedimenticolaceae bacterium]
MAKKTGGKSRAKRTAATSGGGAKFAGVVELTGPGDDDRAAIANGTRVVVSLVEVRVGRLPEQGARAELQLDSRVRTTTADGEALTVGWSPGLFYYVLPESRLNIDDTVIFDGEVYQHLSLDLELVERELPQFDPADAADLAAAAAAATAELVGASGRIGSALDAFPSILGGILKLNGDDQVLKYATSLYTREVNLAAGSGRRLLEGRYRIDKRRSPGDADSAIGLVLDVRGVA